MIKGETVEVLTPSISYDPSTKDEVVVYAGADVDNVLFASPSTEQVEEMMRLYSVHIQYVMHFPKEYAASLRGCRVRRPRDGCTYAIAGDPQPYPPENCPPDVPWNRGAVGVIVDG